MPDKVSENMEQRQQQQEKPSVMITTYSSCPSGYQQAAHHQVVHLETDGSPNSGTRFERSTNLFSNNKQLAHRTRILYELNQIKGPSGSIRGHRDVVKKSLENIKTVAALCGQRNFNSSNLPTFMPWGQAKVHSSTSMPNTTPTTTTVIGANGLTSQRLNEIHRAEYLSGLLDSELDMCVAYTTSLGVVRRTFEDSKCMRSILNLNLIRYEERDIYLNQEYKEQLRMRCNPFTVPALFVDGCHLGGFKEVERMNENGDLLRVLSKFKMSKAPNGTCMCCGNARFIACQSCNGSRKSTIHHFKFSSIVLRCIKCDKNDGLVQCPVCSLAVHPEDKSMPDALHEEVDCNNNNNIDTSKS